MQFGRWARKEDVLRTAEISFDIAVIPALPLKEQIITASTAITQSYENRYLVDYETFPPHLTLVLAGTDQEYIELLIKALDVAVTPFLSSQLTTERLYSGSRGFIGLSCTEDKAMMDLFRAVIGAYATIHQQYPRYRPVTLDHWPSGSDERVRMLKEYGTDKLPPYLKPHFSLAEVAEVNIPMALDLAMQHLLLPQKFAIEKIELVDVGHRNERWNVLHSWPGK